MFGVRGSGSLGVVAGGTGSVDAFAAKGKSYIYSSNEEFGGLEAEASVARGLVFVWGTSKPSDYTGGYSGGNASLTFFEGISVSYTVSDARNSNGKLTKTLSINITNGIGAGASYIRGITFEGLGAFN